MKSETSNCPLDRNWEERTKVRNILNKKQALVIRAAVQRSYGKEQKEKHINETENILLKSCSATEFRNYDYKSSGSPANSTAWNSSRSGKFLACHISYRLLQIFKQSGLQLKERTSRTSKKEPVNSSKIRSQVSFCSLCEGRMI
ncbi:hypothetical protein TNCV_2610871 [Trichonephila clavipes]|nr:hypothetical protein TNCV_2610871 [Trichonephila clavipes]